MSVPKTEVPSASKVSRRSGIAVLLSMAAANAANYGFQIVTGRSLGAAEYGLLGGLMAVVTVISVATGSVQTAAAHAVAAGEVRPSNRAADRFTRTAVMGAAGVTVIGFAISPLLGKFFDVGLLPILGVAALIVPAIAVAIASGRLQGARRFGWMSVLSSAMAGLKLCVGLVVAILGLGVTTLMFGLACSTMVGAIAGLWLARDIGENDTSILSADVGRAMLAFSLFWLLVSADVPFARALMSGDEAGHYAAASVLGKAVLWLPSVVGLLVFPQLASEGAASGAASRVLKRAVGATLALTGMGVAGLYVLGDRLFDLLYGDEYAASADIAWRIGLACVPLALVNLLLYERLAFRRNTFLIWIVTAVVIELAGFTVMHSSGTALTTVLAASATALLAMMLIDRKR